MIDACSSAVCMVYLRNYETRHCWTPGDVPFGWGSSSVEWTVSPWPPKVLRQRLEGLLASRNSLICPWGKGNQQCSWMGRWRCEGTQFKHWEKLWGGCPKVTVSRSRVGVYGERSDCRCRVACLAVTNDVSESTSSRDEQAPRATTGIQSGRSAHSKPRSGMSLKTWIAFWAPIPVKEEFVEVIASPSTSRGFTWEGWGTSLCWWANFVGGLPEDDMNFILDLLFDQEKGLGLTVVRYNIGGGANPVFDTHLRPFGDIPGFKSGPLAAYDWSADERQRKVLLGAIHRGVNLTEAFSNSPPYWMTYSGSVTGNKWWGQENLKPEYHKAFADYITDVVKQYADVCGVKFDYLAAFNEPVEGWWYINKKKKSQEGCNFSVKSAEKVILHLQDLVLQKGLSTVITGFDAWTKNTAGVLKAMSPEAIAVLGQVNVHSYINNVQNEREANRIEVREAVKKLNKKLWMSEYGPLNWNGEELEVALGVARHLTLDLNELQPSAWCYWQAVEEPEGGAWGLLHIPFRYQGSRIAVQLKKQYFALMHFSRWIRPNYRILVHDSVSSFLVVAIDPTEENVIIVGTNSTENNKDIRYDVASVSSKLKLKSLQVALFQTSAANNHTELPRLLFDDSVITVRCDAKSITTMVVSPAT